MVLNPILPRLLDNADYYELTEDRRADYHYTGNARQHLIKRTEEQCILWEGIILPRSTPIASICLEQQ